ncbi:MULTISPECIES: TadE/TadG family type IV pilus assembly protein [unclassified Sphingopyxis]|uniref:TadE/TadG family type IV pilus assembly protein n=1 Tax=unclassified Sphingopyxis TaxID=2614943 RepID=UPI000736DE63|nr:MULTISPECIES: VWA domain-containing protein [unclassified Sphingopyxis]KTE31906.1 hypothetical protein ATE62_18780 [Sphingopyxis sp. HIX]KTE80150.1 hypothetical protein ATE72_18195 [Sphingopyxis sp. HXXIV]
MASWPDFWRGLARDRRGNTLMLVAGMMLPLVAFVGSGIDVSRAYMAKTRLQAACDAGVLAARKVSGTGLTDDGRKVGDEYFNANFGQSSFGSRDVDFQLSQNGSEIIGAASAKLDTAVMRVFGQHVMALGANCRAMQEITNTDVMFVLDTTGSMKDVNPGDSVSRFDAMKEAVTRFHGELEAVKPSGATIRYGFMPYTSTVNVGYSLDRDWMVDKATYQSRRIESNNSKDGLTQYARNDVRNGGSRSERLESTYPAVYNDGGESGLSYYSCPTKPAGNATVKKTLISTRTEPVMNPRPGTRTIETFNEVINGTTYRAVLNGTTCEVRASDNENYDHTFEWVTEPVGLTEITWEYAPITYDVSKLRGLTEGGSVKAKINNDGSNREIPWYGCIEERQTVAADSYDPLPAEALDLQIDLVPSPGDPATQWKPSLPGLVFMRPNVDPVTTAAKYANLVDHWSGQRFCPAPAQKLKPMDGVQLEDYLDTLVATGATHHDIGLLWGARFLSPTGLFRAENRGDQVRHLIFMTDGYISVGVKEYDAYGHPFLDRRRQTNAAATPTSAMLNQEVENRFLALCKATRARGMTIWIVAFGTELTPALAQCSGGDKAFQAANSVELQAAFRKIAGKISKLRLTK